MRSEICTAVGLSVVLDEFEAMLAADLPYPIGIGTAAVEMDNHDGFRTLCDGLLYQRIVDLQGFPRRLYENRLQAALGDGEDGGDICVGRHDDFITALHDSHLHVGSEYQGERIEPIATADAIAGADILGIMLLEPPRGLAFQIPAAIENPTDGASDFLVIQTVDGFQVEILDHRLYS